MARTSNQEVSKVEQTNTPAPKDPNSIRAYECWKVTPEKEDYLDPETGAPKRRPKGTWKPNEAGEQVFYPSFEKVGTEPLNVTNIEPRHAETLNAQAINSGMYYFEI